MLAAIAFVPVTDVVDAFGTVVDASYRDRAKPVVNYFDDNFIV